MTDSPELSTALTTLYESLDNGSKWTPTLFLESTHFQSKENDICVREGDKLSDITVNDTEEIDIIKLLSSTDFLSDESDVLLSKGYPLGAAFQIEGCNGGDDTNKVKSLIRKAALLGGTELVVHSNQKSPNGE